MKWRAWYTDAVYSSETDRWNDLPAEGLQVVVHYHPDGTRTIYDGADWYWLYQGKFGYVPSRDWGTWQPRPDLPCRSCIKQGTGLAYDEFRRIEQMALRSKP